jgi:hypothetical protein
MEPIVRHFLERAAEEAVRLALGSAQYPRRHQPIVEAARVAAVEAMSAFALNARRAMEALPKSDKFVLAQPRWHWAPIKGGEVRFRSLGCAEPSHSRSKARSWLRRVADVAVIDGGALVIPFVQAETDRKAMAFNDPFALSHAFLYQVLPRLQSLQSEEGERPSVH